MKLTKHDMLYVRWRDSVSRPGWHQTSELMEIAEDLDDMLCESVGFLVKATHKTLTIARDSGVDRSSGGEPLRIPRECVLMVRRLADSGGRRLWK